MVGARDSNSLDFLIFLICFLLFGCSAKAETLSITLGPQEKVFDYTTFNCPLSENEHDTVDMPVTAFRRGDGKVLFLASNSNNFEMVGNSVESAQRSANCKKLIFSNYNPNPASYDYKSWLQAVYKTKLGETLGLIHHEYHGEDITPVQCQPDSNGKHTCWYGSALVAISQDGGNNFIFSPSFSKVLATPPYPYQIGIGRMGYSSPKVVRLPDTASNKFAVFVLASHGINQSVTVSSASGTCLFIGSGSNTANWRGWNGSSFSTIVKDPYTPGGSLLANLCEPVIDLNIMSVKFIPAKNLFLAIGYRPSATANRTDLMFSTSNNLISWSEPQLLRTFISHRDWQPGDIRPSYYHSLLDPDSSSVNFDTLENRPFLYHAKWKTSVTEVLDDERLLYRQPMFLNWE